MVLVGTRFSIGLLMQPGKRAGQLKPPPDRDNVADPNNAPQTVSQARRRQGGGSRRSLLVLRMPAYRPKPADKNRRKEKWRQKGWGRTGGWGTERLASTSFTALASPFSSSVQAIMPFATHHTCTIMVAPRAINIASDIITIPVSTDSNLQS